MAGEAESFKVSLIADARDLDNKIAKARSQMDKFSREQKERAKTRFTATIADLQVKLDMARAELRKFKKEGDKTGQLEARIKILGLQKNIKDARGLLRDLDKSTTSTKKGFFHLNGIVRDAVKAFGGLFIIRQVQGLFSGLFRSVVSFDSAFAGVRKTIDATEEEFAELSKGFRKLATSEIPLAVEELLKIGELGGQLGIAKEELIEFTEVIAKLGVTTNLSTEEAAKSFARIKNVFRLTNKDVERLGSSLVDLGNKVAADEAEILNFANRLSGVGNAMGLTAQETFGVAAAFRSVGVEAESGGTAIQKALLEINDIVSKGGKELELFAKLSGKTTKEFADTWRNEPVKALDDFVKIVSSAGSEGSVVIEELIGSNERLKRAFLTIAGSGDLLSNTIGRANMAFESNSALTEEANKRFATLESRIQKIKNFFADLGRNVGGPVAEAFVSFGETVVDILKGGSAFREYAGIIKNVGIAIITYLSYKTLSGIRNGFIGIAESGLRMKQALNGLQFGKLGAGLVGMINPLLTIATIAIPAVINAWASAKLESITLNNSLKSLVESLEDLSERRITTRGYFEGIKKDLLELKEIRKEVEAFDVHNAPQKELFMIRAREEMQIRSLINEYIALGEAYGKTAQQTYDFLNAQGLNIETIDLSSETMDNLNDNITQFLDEGIAPLDKKFSSTFSSMGKTTDTFGETFSKTMEILEKDLGGAAKTITENYIRMAGEAGDIGAAFTIGLEQGLTREEIVQRLHNAGIKNIQELIGLQLKEAIHSKETGNVISALIAAGISEEEAKVIAASDDVMTAVTKALRARLVEVQANGEAVGQAAGAGIARGFSKVFPVLNKMASQAKSIISTLSPQTAENIDSFAGRVQSSLGKLKSLAQQVEAQNIEKTLAELERKPTADTSGVNTSVDNEYKPSGGGGGNTALKEAQAAVKESAKIASDQLKDFEKNLEETTKKSSDLAKRVKDFYAGIAKSIKDAKDRQKELTKELDSFKNEETQDFIKSIAERNAEIINQEKALNDEISKIREEATKNQSNIDDELIEKQQRLNLLRLQLSEYDENTKESTKLAKEQSIEKLEAEIQELSVKEGITSETERLLSAEKELQKIKEEKASIEAIAARNTQLSKDQIQEIFDIEKKRASLNDVEREEFDLQSRIAEKEKEIKAEIEAQQRIIDLRTKFLEIIAGDEEKSVVENAKRKRELLGITNEAIFEDEEKFNERLKELGFAKLSEEEKIDLLKLASQEKSFGIEERKLFNQQQELLSVKKEFIMKAEKALDDSVDRQKQKVQELINKIREAQAEMNLIGGSRGSGLDEGRRSFEINQTNNINSQVDLNSSFNKLLQKIN